MIRLLALIAWAWVFPTIDQYNALIGTTLSRGKTPTNLNVGAGVTTNLDAAVGGSDVVTAEADLTGSAAGDLTIQCFPYAADGVTVLGTSLPAISGVGYVPALVSGHVSAVQSFNVQGIDKVRFAFKNNNAGAQTLNASWRVENN